MDNIDASNSKPPDVPAVFKDLYMNVNTITCPESTSTLKSAMNFLREAGGTLNADSLELPEFFFMNLLEESQHMQQPLPQMKETFEKLHKLFRNVTHITVQLRMISKKASAHRAKLRDIQLQIMEKEELLHSHFEANNQKIELDSNLQELKSKQVHLSKFIRIFELHKSVLLSQMNESNEKNKSIQSEIEFLKASYDDNLQEISRLSEESQHQLTEITNTYTRKKELDLRRKDLEIEFNDISQKVVQFEGSSCRIRDELRTLKELFSEETKQYNSSMDAAAELGSKVKELKGAMKTIVEAHKSHLEPLVERWIQLLNQWELGFENYQVMGGNSECPPIYQEAEQDQLIHGGREKINENNRVAGSDYPELVKIAHAHMDDLAPDKHLAASIIDFYIRYLQQTSLKTDECPFLFHDTKFYNKLHGVLSSEQNDTGTLYMNLRKSLKDPNIFQKAYVLIPIHEEYHWTLAIICIPDRKDISGPIIWHLNSSRPVLDNFKRFLIKEWEILKEKSDCSEDMPIASEVWMKLDEKIEEEIIAVPKSSAVNSGFFVLHLMKRFIDEIMAKAPDHGIKTQTGPAGRTGKTCNRWQNRAGRCLNRPQHQTGIFRLNPTG